MIASSRHERLAWVLFTAHCAIIVTSTIALTTFLAGGAPPWLARPESQTALRVGWAFSGPTFVMLGAAAALIHAAGRFGWRRALALLAAAVAISLTAELVGTATGYPFGGYAYTPLLGYRIGGRVPFPIPMSWFYMIYASLSMVGAATRHDDGWWARARRALAAGLVLTAWDAAMDPAMVRTAHWVWQTDGFFYGMPLSNWGGWLLVGTIIAWVAQGIVPSREWSSAVPGSSFPAALYVANTLFPVAICLRHGLWWAAALGMVGAIVAAGLAVRRWVPAPVRAASGAAHPALDPSAD